MRNGHLLLLCAGMALAACGDSTATSAPPSTAATVSASGQTSAESADDEAATEGIRDHHRHHHGGVVQYILISLDTLGITPEQKAKVDAVKSDLNARTAPARDAERALLSTIADGVAAGNVDTAPVDSALAALARASAAAHDASADALNQLHQVLTPEERIGLVDKVQAHWAVWRSVNAEEKVGSHEKGTRLAHFATEENLSADQVEKISAALHAAPEDPRAHVDPSEMEGLLRTFTTAFAADTFDAKSMTGGGAASGHIATAGGARLARFFEAAAPVLTPEQRAGVAQHLRDRLDATASSAPHS